MANLSATFNNLQAQLGQRNVAAVHPANDCGEYPTVFLNGLEEMGLSSPTGGAQITAMRTGANSQICRVRTEWGTLCIKRALPVPRDPKETKLPTERNAYEREWLKLARAVVGESVPEVIGELPTMFAMEHLEPDRFPAWSALLGSGEINPSTAAELGRTIGRIHAATANNFALGQRFASDRIFDAARIAPIFLAAANKQPTLAERLQRLAIATARTKIALVHGDLSPENVLIGPKGPVLIDAEYACYGDPSFDVAFFLSHLLLLCIYKPNWRDVYLTCYEAFSAAYAQRVTWEIPEHTDERAALLIPALLLGHVYASSPAAYLRQASNQKKVVAFSRRLLIDPVLRIAAVRESWRRTNF